jgi:hypothetical protein
VFDGYKAHGLISDFRDGDGLRFADGDAALAVAAIVGVAHDDAVAFLFVDFRRANGHAFPADFAFGFVNCDYVHISKGISGYL